MCRCDKINSSKSSLLAVVSAVILAASVGSGVFAQTAVEYTHSSGDDSWADGAARNASNTSSTDMANARAGDNLTLSGGRVYVEYPLGSVSNAGILKRRIGKLFNGTGGAGELRILGSDLIIGEIIKRDGSREAVDITISGRPNFSGRSDLTVEGDAFVGDLLFDFGFITGSFPQGKAIFKYDLTAEGTTRLKAGNSSRPVNVLLELRGDATFGGDVTLDDQGAGGRAYIKISGSNDQKIGRRDNGAAKITAAADGEGTIWVFNGVDHSASKRATFDIEIGHDDATDANDRRLRQLTVGDSSGSSNGGKGGKGGHAIFNKGVHVDHIDVIAGKDRREKAIVEFRGDVSGDTIKLTSTYWNQDAMAIFNALAGDITVDNKIVVDGRYPVDLVRILGSKVTFNGKIGSDDKPLSYLSVGWNGAGVAKRYKSAGEAVFKEDVHSGFLRVDGGQAADEQSQATVEKNLDIDPDESVQLSDYSGSATLTIGGAGRLATVNDGGQTISGSIVGGGDGQGTLIVDNRGDAFPGRTTNNTVTFMSQIGSDSRALRQITLKDGRATFSTRVYADMITIDTSDATVFKGNVKVDTGFHLGASSGSVIFRSRADQRIFGTGAASITVAADGEGTIQVLNGRDDRDGEVPFPPLNFNAPPKVTFDMEIGRDVATDPNNRRLGQLTVGDSSGGGHAIFNKGVHVDHIDVIAGKDRREKAIVEFRGDVSGSAMRLGEGGNGEATIIFNALGGDKTVGLTIDGASAGVGHLLIYDGDAGSSDTITFTGGIGRTGNLRIVSVGDGGFAGSAVFKGDVNSGDFGVNGGDAAGEASQATVEKDLTASMVRLADNAGSATLTIGGAGRLATVNDTTGQLLSGSIVGGGDGQGTLIVDNRGNGTNNNSTVTFMSQIGSDRKALRQITLKDGRTTFFRGVSSQGLEVSSTDGAEFRRNVTTGGILFAVDNEAKITLNGTANQTVTGDITPDSDGRGLLVVNNSGMTNNNTVTFTGQIGTGGDNGKALQKITVSDGVAQFEGAVFAQGLEVSSTDGAEFRGNVKAEKEIKLGDGSAVTFNGAAGQTITGNIMSASGGNYGTIIIDNDDGVTFKGALGTNSAKLNSLTLTDDSRAIFAGNVYLANGLKLGNSTITFGGSGNQTIQADIRNSTAGERGFVVVNNSGTTNRTVTFEDAVGATGNDLASVVVSDGVAVFKGDVFAQGLGVISTDGAEFRGDVTTGALGILFAVNNEAKITLNGTANQTVTGDITPDSDGRGLLVVNNAGTTNNNTVTFTGQIGTGGDNGKALQKITVSNGVAQFEGAVFARGLVVSSTDGAKFKGNVTTGGISFGGNDDAKITLNGAVNQTVTGDITPDSDGRGLLVVNNTHATTNKVTFKGRKTCDLLTKKCYATTNKVTFTGRVGTDGAALKQITLSEGRTTFNGDVYAGNLTITARDATTFRGNVKADREFELGKGSSVTFGGTAGQRITGNITSASGGNYGTIIIANTHADGVTFGGQLGTSGHGLRSLTVNEGAKVTFTRPVYLSGTLRLKTGTTLVLGDYLTRRDDATQAFVTVGDYAFDGDFTEANRVKLILPLSFTSGTQKVFSAHDTLDKEKFSFAGNNLVNYSYDFDDDGTDVTVKEKGSDVGDEGNQGDGSGGDDTDVKVADKDADAGDEGNQGDGSGDTDVKVADKDADKDAGDEGNQGDGSGDTDVKVADKDADKDAGDEGNQGDGSGDTDVKVADKDADKDAGDEGNQGDGSGDTDVKVADKDADKDAGDEGNQGDGSGDTDVKVADKDADKDAGDEGNQGDGSGDTDVKVADKDADKDAGDEGNQGDGSGDTDVKVADKDADAGDEGNQGDGSGDTDVKVADKDAGDEGNQGDGSGDTDVKVADKDADKDAGDEGNQGDGSGDTDVKVADKDADAGDEGNQGDGSGDTDVKVADKDADKDAGDEGNQGDGSGDTDVKVADKDADKDAGDEGNQGDGSGDTDVKVADKDADKDAGDEGNQGDGSGDTDVKVADKDADKDAGDEGNQGDGSGDTDVKVADKDADAGDEGNQGDGSGDTDVKVADKDAGDEGNQGDGSGDTDVKVADKDADKDAGDEGNQGDGSGDTDVKVADKDADKDAGDEGNQGDGSGDTDVKVADKDADKDAGDEGNQGDGSGDTDVKVADKDADAGDEGNQGDGSGDTDVKVADKDADAGDEGNQGDGSGDTDVKVADKDADKDAGDEGNQGDGSGDTDVKVADKDADKDAGDEGNQGDGSGDTDVKVADKDADKDAGDEGNQGDGSGDTDVKVADKDADKDAGDEGNQGDGSGDTDVKVADKDADKDAGDEGNQGDGSGDTDVKEVAGKDKDADRDVPLNLKSGGDGSGSDDTDVKDVDDKDADRDVDVADKGLSRPIALMTPNAVGFKSAGEVSSKLGVSLSEATVLLAAADVAKDLPANDPVKKILEEATRAGNEAQVRRLAAQLTPQMTALVGVRRAVLSTGRQVAGLLSDRLALQRGGDSQSGFVQSGFATGGEGLDRAFWLKPFGSRGEQAKDRKRAIDGYRTSARGLAVGVDAPVGERGRVGTALAYSTSRITGKGFGEDKTDVRSWQVSIYGDYSTGRYYVDGQVGVGRNDVSTTSRVAGLRRKSAYDTTSLTASVGGGVPLRLDASTTLTPTAGLSWTRVGSARYTTTGALSLNQKITVGSIDAVVGTLGTRIQRDITRKHSNRTLVPVARVGLSYDFAGEQMTARGRFTGGGSRFTVKGAKVRKLSGTAGVGLSYSTPRWSIGADYDVSARTGYTGHSARLNAKVKF